MAGDWGDEEGRQAVRFDRRKERFRGESWVYRHTGYPGYWLGWYCAPEHCGSHGSDKPKQGMLFRRGYVRGDPCRLWLVTKPKRL